MDKGPDAFRTISEVADDLDIPQHVLRFWETRFAQIKPLKRGGGRRYYRPDDIDLLKGIRHLLYGEGYTIKGVQRILREEGVRFVQGAWHGGVSLPQRHVDDADEAEPAPAPAAGQQYGLDYGQGYGQDDRHEEAWEGEEGHDYAAPGDPAAKPAARDQVREARAQGRAAPPRPGAASAGGPMRFAAIASDRAVAPKRSELAHAPAFEHEPTAGPSARLSADDCQRLQVALAELAECRRILGLARRADASFDETTD
jgi:DNA-binding transcriptional MerR regulator